MRKYLDPKTDLTFKKIFGQHENLLVSFLNAMLDLKSPIVSLNYLPAELVPQRPRSKNTIVDVRCVDADGRHFIVEMQMAWTNDYYNRILYNASKVYSQQAVIGGKYRELQPVYALSIINDNFTKKSNYWQHYSILDNDDSQYKIEGLEFVFIELPKFKATTFSEKRLQVQWLQFLSMNEGPLEDPSIMEVPEINEALDLLAESAFSDDEMLIYDKDLDIMRTEKTLAEGKFKDGKIEGKEEGLKEGIEIGKEEGIEIGKEEGIEIGKQKGIEIGKQKANKASALQLKQFGVSIEIIMKTFGLSEKEINDL